MDLPSLSKATLINTDSGERIAVMYNPEQYSLEQANDFAEVGIPGLGAPPLQYVRGRARTLSMDLFFDTYERNEDVRNHSGKVVNLLNQLPTTHAPPVLLFTMGQFSFRCVLASASQRYTMFSRDGSPVRATVSVKFQEYVDVPVNIEPGVFVGGAPVVAPLGPGQTLAQLAGQYLGDPSRWREIAEKNGIDDPFNVPGGATLTIPGTGQP